MSFVNLMGKDLWSEADIVNRTETMIASEFPRDAVAILNRKTTGAVLGQYAMTVAEQAELERYAQICAAARQAGIDARADNVLLTQVLDMEVAQRRLDIPLVEPVLDDQSTVLNQLDIDTDLTERSAAQSVIDSATTEAHDLFVLRNPPPPEPEVVV